MTTKIDDVRFMPTGKIVLYKGNDEQIVAIDPKGAISAARAIIDSGKALAFNSQAEIVVEAINTVGWGVGSKGFKAKLLIGGK